MCKVLGFIPSTEGEGEGKERERRKKVEGGEKGKKRRKEERGKTQDTGNESSKVITGVLNFRLL
jgi:hypothetical protein